MKWWAWAVVTLALGALLRLPELGLRPMHTDEAVHAVKLSALLETGVYRYDRNEYHGPTLNYFTLPPARLMGQKNLAELTERTLRVVPAFFGIGLILLILSLRSAGRTAVALAAILAAASPTLTFYSRYYIQEILLTCFTMGLIVSGYRYAVSKRIPWAVAAGIFAGLMFATKETWVISIGVMVVAIVVTLRVRRGTGMGSSGSAPGVAPSRRPAGLAAGVVAGVAACILVSALFFSSFFTHWEGVLDSFLAYRTYFERAGESARHGQPWHYFIRMLVWWSEGPGPVWTEGAIAIFAAVGIAGSFTVAGRSYAGVKKTALSRRAGVGDAGAASAASPAGQSAAEPAEGRYVRPFRMFLAVYACLMLVIISAIPYKTPWLVLGALLPIVLMAGWGVADFLAWLPARAKVPGYLLIALAGGHLVWQSYLANFRHYDDPSNPMVYSHPNDDVRQIAGIVQDVALAAPADLYVQVVVSGDEYWPLPWYLRRLSHVGWWGVVTDEFVPTPLILVSPDREQDLMARLYESGPPGERRLYVPLFDKPMFLRPGKEIRGYVTLDLSDRLRRMKGSGEG